MLDTILPDLPFEAGQEVALSCSPAWAPRPSWSSTSSTRGWRRSWPRRKITVRFNFVGNLFTSLEMMGVTLTVMKLDEELKACLAHPCRSLGLSVKG